jgi:hypothetical protein
MSLGYQSAVFCQLLMQVQAISSLPSAEKYKGAIDALVRIPHREGFLVTHRIHGLQNRRSEVVHATVISAAALVSDASSGLQLLYWLSEWAICRHSTEGMVQMYCG